ncbi:MAG: alkaline phosphatase family protein [Mycoplasmataceae bacterium]|nr:alkaline phosphatase family protein [Mycoplasmataceae bacterium]
MKKFLEIVPCGLVLFTVSTITLTSCGNNGNVDDNSFFISLDKSRVFKNKTSERIGEPSLYQYMYEWLQVNNNHKLLFIGFDGCRADAVSYYVLNNKTSILSDLATNGELLLGFCGGINQTQQTSTSPGWTSLLTGEWGATNGVTTNHADTQLLPGHHTIMYNLQHDSIDSSYTSSQWLWNETWHTDFDEEGGGFTVWFLSRWIKPPGI